MPKSLLIASIARAKGSSIPPGGGVGSGTAGGVGFGAAATAGGGDPVEGRRTRKRARAARRPAAIPPVTCSASSREKREGGRASARGTVRTAVHPPQRRRLPAVIPVILNLLPQKGQRTRRRDIVLQPSGTSPEPTTPHRSRKTRAGPPSAVGTEKV